MTKREYLRSLGFVVGERGRFSAEQITALENAPEGTIVEPVKPEPKPRVAKRVAKVTALPAAQAASEQTAAAPTPLKVYRKENVLYALTPVGQTHAVVGYSSCQRCHFAVQNCPCNVPKPPAGAIPVNGKPVA